MRISPFKNNPVSFVTRFASVSVAILSALIIGEPAVAQRASENAVNNAEDAFGGTVGNETTGIYTDTDVRGFSPQRAGNARMNGIYFDQVGTFSYRLKASQTIRVGLAALNFPFPAPTGIIDYKLRSAGDEQILSLAVTGMPYGGFLFESDLAQPVIKGHVSVSAGFGVGRAPAADGSGNRAYSVSLRPQFKFSGFDISPFVAASINRGATPQLIFASTGPFAPPQLDPQKYLGQQWTEGEIDTGSYGILGNGSLLQDVSLRAGWFHFETERRSNFSEFYTYIDSGLPNHTVIADPKQRTYANSWETMLAWAPTVSNWQNRILLGARGRKRVTESGGSNIFAFGRQSLGSKVAAPALNFGAVDENTVEQSSIMAGYMLERLKRFQLNIGVQKASYKAVSRRTLVTTSTATAPWLYNASISYSPVKSVQLYAEYVKGLEDSGTAPETAANRNDQLPASSTEQWDAGLQVHMGPIQFIASVFQIQKPYFSFDALNRFAELGSVRHRGVELSLSGKITDRLQLVAGAVFINARVSSTGTLLAIGSRPVGVPSLRVRIDANYRTDFLGGLTPTLSLTYMSERAGSANRFALLNNEQVMLPTSVRLDLGLRKQFSMGGIPASFRLTVANVFDENSWKPIASGLYQLDDRRRYTVSLIADL